MTRQFLNHCSANTKRKQSKLRVYSKISDNFMWFSPKFMLSLPLSLSLSLYIYSPDKCQLVFYNTDSLKTVITRIFIVKNILQI